MTNSFGETVDSDGFTQQQRRDNGLIAYTREILQGNELEGESLVVGVEGEVVATPAEVLNGIAHMARVDVDIHGDALLDPSLATECAKEVHEVIASDTEHPLEETIAAYFVAIGDKLMNDPYRLKKFIDDVETYLILHAKEICESTTDEQVFAEEVTTFLRSHSEEMVRN